MVWKLIPMLTFIALCLLLAGGSSAAGYYQPSLRFALKATPHVVRAFPRSGSGFYSVGSSARLNANGGYSSTIVALFSKSCVDVNGGSAQVGAGIDEWNCTGTANQSFNVNPTTDGYFVIQSQVNTLCLDAGAGSLTTGTQLVQKACSGGQTQKWKLIANGDGTYFITTPDGSGCLDIFGGRTANGTSVITYACHNGDNQKFVLSGLGSSPSLPP